MQRVTNKVETIYIGRDGGRCRFMEHICSIECTQSAALADSSTPNEGQAKPRDVY